LTEWGSKYVGAVVRIAGLLHFAEHGEAGHRYPVDPETIRAAERIGNYFKATAINVFTGMADPNIADAVYLLDRVASLDSEEMSQRELFNACSRPRFPTMAALLPALNRLVEHGWLISLEVSKSTKAGRPASPATWFTLPPNTQNTQKGSHDRVLQVLRILRQGSIAVSTILFRHVGERYTVRFSYDPDLVELLKGTVSACARSWDLMNYTPDIWVPNVYASVCDAHFSAWRPHSSAREERPGG
jgi:hypothetical protein